MSASEDAAAVRRGYEAFARADMAALQELFAPDIRWHVNGRNRTAGTFEGVASVLGTFGRLAADTGGTFRVEVHDLMASDDHVVVLARASADRQGRHFEGNYAHVFHLSGGKVTEAWIVNEDPYASDEFWAD
jgi:ketosteroid isomerase-like protein